MVFSTPLLYNLFRAVTASRGPRRGGIRRGARAEFLKKRETAPDLCKAPLAAPPITEEQRPRKPGNQIGL